MMSLIRTEIVYHSEQSAILLELGIGQRFINNHNKTVWEVDEIYDTGAQPDDILVTFKDITTDNPKYTYSMKYLRQRMNFGEKYLSLV